MRKLFALLMIAVSVFAWTRSDVTRGLLFAGVAVCVIVVSVIDSRSDRKHRNDARSDY